MNIIEKVKQRRLIETEEHLRLLGNEQCSKCNLWMGKEYIIEKICNDCKLEETKNV